MKRQNISRSIHHILLLITFFVLSFSLQGVNAPITTAATITTAVPGQQVTVPVTVSGFTSIGSFYLSMDYEYAKLHFVSGTSNPLLEGSTNIGDIDLGNGIHRLIISWFKAGATGTSLPAGSWIANYVFAYVSGPALLQWFDMGPSCEYTDPFGNSLNDIPTSTYYTNGLVSSYPSAPIVGAITQPTCTMATGSLGLSGLPAGNWTINPGAIEGTGSSTILSDLAAGIYNFTVTNELGYTSTPTDNVSINAQPATPETPAVTITQSGCTEATGMITVTAPTGTGMTYSIDGTTYTNTTGVFTLLPGGIYTVTAKSAEGCISAGTSVTIITPGITVSGTITYFNTSNTGMNNISVRFRQSGSDVYTADTDGSGFYSFTNVCPGDYDVEFLTEKPAGGINSSDAAQVNAWSVGPRDSIEKVRFFAVDVIGDNYLLASDAGRILAYFLTGGAIQMTPIWTFWNTNDMTVTQNPLPNALRLNVPSGSGPITRNYYSLVTGDFNSSFTPATKSLSETVTVKYRDTIMVEPNAELDLPVFTEKNIEVGAISLILKFPSDKLDILSVTLGNDAISPVQYNVSGDELRIGWFAITPVKLNASDKLLTLRVRVTGSLAEGEIVRFSLASVDVVELSDGDYNTISNATLTMNTIGGTALPSGDVPQETCLSLTDYPNPFKGTTTFSHILPYDGKVILEIYNLLGYKVLSLPGEGQKAGTHTIKLDVEGLVPRVHMATLKLATSGSVYTRTIKVVRNLH